MLTNVKFESLVIFSTKAIILVDCLAAANQIINECDVSVYSEEKKEKFCETKANIHLCWNKYCLNLLRLSAESKDE